MTYGTGRGDGTIAKYIATIRRPVLKLFEKQLDACSSCQGCLVEARVGGLEVYSLEIYKLGDN